MDAYLLNWPGTISNELLRLIEENVITEDEGKEITARIYGLYKVSENLMNAWKTFDSTEDEDYLYENARDQNFINKLARFFEPGIDFTQHYSVDGESVETPLPIAQIDENTKIIVGWPYKLRKQKNSLGRQPRN